MAESAGDRLRVLKRVFDSVYTSSASDRDLDRVMELYAENAVFEVRDCQVARTCFYSNRCERSCILSRTSTIVDHCSLSCRMA